MSGVNATQRRPLGELRSTNAPRAGSGRLGGGATVKKSTRPATSHPSRRCSELPVTGSAMHGKAIAGRSESAGAGGAAGSVPVHAERKADARGKCGSMEDRLSAELLRLLEERSQGKPSPQKVSPHKEVAERASEECPRRPLTRDKAGAATKTPAASRITPCAPSEPKVAAHARKTFKAASRSGGSSRPISAAPRMEQDAPQGAGLEASTRYSNEGCAAPAKHRAPEQPASSRESSRERSGNGAASASARAPKGWERVPEAKRTDAPAAPPGERARAAEGQKVAARAKATIADLIARFRNGPPQRPDQRKAAGESSSMFWWRKDGTSEADSASGEESVACSNTDAKDPGSAEGSLAQQQRVAGSASGDAGDADDDARASRGRSAKRAAGADAARTSGNGAALRNAWSELDRQSLELPGRSSAGSLASIIRGDASIHSSRSSCDGGSAARIGSEAAWRSDSQSDSECARSVKGFRGRSVSLDSRHAPSARTSVDSIDERTSAVLRQASSAMDSTLDRTSDAGGISCSSSSPSALKSQLDEAEDLLEQWRAERRMRQVSAGASARPAGGSSHSRAASSSRAGVHKERRTNQGGGANELGDSDSADSCVDGAVSRIRRRLGMGMGSVEPGTYARRMRQMTARHSSDSETELLPPRQGESEGERASPRGPEHDAGGVDPLSKWRGERGSGARRSASSERGSVSEQGSLLLTSGGAGDFRTRMASSAGAAERTQLAGQSWESAEASQRGGRNGPSGGSSSSAPHSYAPANAEGQRTPRSSATSVASSHASVSSKSKALSPVTPTPGSPQGRAAAAARLLVISPRSSCVGSVSPRRGAVERVHLSEALEAVVEKVLFSALGEHVVDSLFKGMSVQSVPNTCTCTLCPCVSTGSTCGKARVHWKRDDGGEEPREVARPENHPEKEEAFHFREIGYARWDSREDESRQKRDHAWRSSSPDLSPTGKFDKTHISIPANEDLAAARDSPWNKTGKSDEMPRFSHTVWSENLSKTPGGANCSLSHTRGTHNTSIVENIEASPSCTRHLHLTRTRQTDHNVSITEVLNVSLSEGPANASIVSEDDAPVRIDDTPRAERASEHGFGVGGDDGRGVEYGGGRGHRRGKSIDGNCCILEDLDMADSETGEVFVDRGGGVRGGVSAKMCERVHAAGALDGEIPEDDGQEEDEGDEEDAIVRALRQRMQQISSEIEALRD